MSQVGVDEKAFRKGHSYLTLVNDLSRGRVLYVAEERKQSSLDGFWETLTTEQIRGNEAVAMDMWDLTSRQCENICQRPKAKSFSTSFM